MDEQRGDDDKIVFEPLLRVLGVIAQVLPLTTEIVVHDFRKLPRSIIWIHGTVTNREYGDPPTNLLLAHLAQGAANDLLNYNTTLPDGRSLICSTLILRNQDGVPVGSVCFNNETSDWDHLRATAKEMLRATGALDGTFNTNDSYTPDHASTKKHPTGVLSDSDPPDFETVEVFPQSVEDLASILLNAAVTEVGVPVTEMKKRHKLEVIRLLQDRGFFLIRDGIELSAQLLNVTRFTIYNYLKEIYPAEVDTDTRKV